MPERFFVPSIGTRITLTEPWSFKLHVEHRNRALLMAMKVDVDVRHIGSFEYLNSSYVDNDYNRGLVNHSVQLPPGTVLEVDRVYVRSTNKGKTGHDNYDSITFRVVKHPEFKKKHRFWVKLEDANGIVFERDVAG